MKAREGDLIESEANLIFDVKGLVHPPNRVVAFIRYFPNEKGNRTREGKHFDKVYSLPRRYALLKERFPEYLVYDPVFDETLCEVPAENVKEIYKPADKLQEMRKSKNLDPVQNKALRFAELLKESAGIKWNNLGISGSIMVGLHTTESDIDPVVYGSENCRKVYSALKSMFENGNESVKAYSKQDMKALFDFRSRDTAIGFEDFVRTESRKMMEGKFDATDYFVRFVKDWNEIDEKYGDVQYKNIGNARIEATVIDDSESTFTPCNYKIENVRLLEGSKVDHIDEITSFRGRFCEQAKKGETVAAQGKVERVTHRKKNTEHFRLLVGGRHADHIVLKHRVLSSY
jgi:predicted nucleotidyltransferase